MNAPATFTAPTFEFTHNVDRGGWDFEVEVTYSFDGSHAEIVKLDRAPPLSRNELDAIEEHMWEVAAGDFSAWQDDHADFLADMHLPTASEASVPGAVA